MIKCVACGLVQRGGSRGVACDNPECRADLVGSGHEDVEEPVNEPVKKANIRLIPFETMEGNEMYQFNVGKHKVKVVIDGLNDDLLIRYSPEVSDYTFCSCPDHGFRRRDCKHLKEVFEYLKDMGITWREEYKDLNITDS